MSQPVANDGYYHLTGTAAGTVVVRNHPVNFNSFTIGTLVTGTVTFFDCAGTAGTTATNQLMSYTGALRDSHPNITLKQGLVALVSGTTDAILGVG